MVYLEPPLAGDEADTLLGSLERQRATFAWKCSGVDASGMRATVGASVLTLGGLLKHLALVEDEYFTRRLHQRPLGKPWSEIDWEANPDWPWESAAYDSPDQLLTLWLDAVNRSRDSVAEALEADGVGQLARFALPDGQAPSLRRILVDLIEEYARHTGHADLLREQVDGATGEGAPKDFPVP